MVSRMRILARLSSRFRCSAVMQLVKAGRLGILVDVADCRSCDATACGGVQELASLCQQQRRKQETVSTAGFLGGIVCPGHGHGNLSGQHFDASDGKVVCFSAIFEQIA